MNWTQLTDRSHSGARNLPKGHAVRVFRAATQDGFSGDVVIVLQRQHVRTTIRAVTPLHRILGDQNPANQQEALSLAQADAERAYALLLDMLADAERRNQRG